MAATGEVAPELDLARRSLDELTEVGNVGRWEPTPDGRWSLPFEVRPDGLNPAGRVPPVTTWRAVVAAAYPAGGIDIMPAMEGGLTETFPHQLPNDPIGEPWRGGKICLTNTIDGRELAAARDEPDEPYERLLWHVFRTCEWLRDASFDRLLAPDDPFELPVFGQRNDRATSVAFSEGPESFAAWAASPVTFGIADLAPVASDRRQVVLAVKAWRDVTRGLVFEPAWGSHIAAAGRHEAAIWLRFPHLLVRPPWRAPQTWGEIRSCAADEGIDLDEMLKPASHAVRDRQSHHVLLGFPIPRRMGESPVAMTWVSFRQPALVTRRQLRPRRGGPRPISDAWDLDRSAGALRDDVPLLWIRTENWHHDDLATRGRFEGALANRPVALLGAGALGSEIGRLLVRAGVHDLVILDSGDFEAGNLARHELSIPEIRANKAEALASRLNMLSPHARVVGFGERFPPIAPAARAALDRAEVVINATASNSVAKAMGRYAWPAARLFAAASFSFGARWLYLFLADGDTFPSEAYAAAQAPWFKADERPITDFPREGIGCWSAVFPARADEVASLAAIAVGQIDARLVPGRDAAEFIAYGRDADGSITRLATPPSQQ